MDLLNEERRKEKRTEFIHEHQINGISNQRAISQGGCYQNEPFANRIQTPESIAQIEQAFAFARFCQLK